MGRWPDTSVAVAAHGVPGTTLRLPDTPLPPSEWEAVLASIVRERITGLLAAAIGDGALPVTPEQAGAAARAHGAAMASCLLLERMLVRTADRLAGAGVDVRVLKGAAAAHLDYDDPALRAYGDVDLLLRGSQFERAVTVLIGAGHTRRYPEPRPGFDRRFSKGSCLVAPDGLELDCHRTFAMGPFGLTIDLDDLWAESEPFALAGRALRALDREHRFLHACFHAALGDMDPRLSTLRDIAAISIGGELDEARVRAVAAAWKAEAVVARALRLLEENFAVPAEGGLGAWARARPQTPQERRALAVYLDPQQTYAAKSFAAVRAIPGVRDKAAFLNALIFPRQAYVRGRHSGILRRWCRGAAQVARSFRHAH